MDAKLVICVVLVASSLWLLSDSFPSGSVTTDQCLELRCNLGVGNALFHGAEDDFSIENFINVTITEMTDSPAIIDRHYKYKIHINVTERDLFPSIMGWMAQVRDNGSAGADYLWLRNSTVRGTMFTETQCGLSDTWRCPREPFRDPNNTIPELDNGISHKESSFNFDPTADPIWEIEFLWAPVIKNGTFADGRVNWITDIPICGKLVFTLMFKQGVSPKFTWVHARESFCFISTTQEGTPVVCFYDQRCGDDTPPEDFVEN